MWNEPRAPSPGFRHERTGSSTSRRKTKEDVTNPLTTPLAAIILMAHSAFGDLWSIHPVRHYYNPRLMVDRADPILGDSHRAPEHG